MIPEQVNLLYTLFLLDVAILGGVILLIAMNWPKR
jgi:hypothetical protein